MDGWIGRPAFSDPTSSTVEFRSSVSSCTATNTEGVINSPFTEMTSHSTRSVYDGRSVEAHRSTAANSGKSLEPEQRKEEETKKEIQERKTWRKSDGNLIENSSSSSSSLLFRRMVCYNLTHPTVTHSGWSIK